MKTIARILLCLVALFFLFFGFRLMFQPSAAAAGLQFAADTTLGWSNIRALFGGAIAAIGVMPLIAAVKAEIVHARAAVIFLLCVIVGRLAGFVFDGVHENAALVLVVPVVAFSLLVVAHVLLDKVSAQATAGES